MMGWWRTATREQRLAQIDGAIELGMTAKQCAMNCGCVYDRQGMESGALVYKFAFENGRHFEYDADKLAVMGLKTSARNNRRYSLVKAKESYLAGEPVNFWGAE